MPYKDKALQLEKVKQGVRLRRKRVKEYIDSYKTECSICGYNTCKAALEFHHVNEEHKLFQLSSAIQRNYGWEKINTEISKCVLLCGNCHQELHSGLHEETELVLIKLKEIPSHIRGHYKSKK